MSEDGKVDDHEVGKLMFYNTGSTFPQNKIISCYKIRVKSAVLDAVNSNQLGLQKACGNEINQQFHHK